MQNYIGSFQGVYRGSIGLYRVQGSWFGGSQHWGGGTFKSGFWGVFKVI